jgi:glycosyltransferase involved in cell wall biosynthesis
MGWKQEEDKFEGGLWADEGCLREPCPEQPRVSVITTCRNSARGIERTIDSVLGQTYPNIEYIVIDGCSTDGTVDVIRKYEDRLTYWVSEPCEGRFNAVNRGIALATGELVGVLDCNASYLPQTVEEVVEASLAQPGAQVVHGHMQLLDEYGRLTGYNEGNLVSIKQKFELNAPTCFIKRSLLEEEGFRTDFKLLADYELLLRLHLAGVWFYPIDKPLARSRLAGTGSAGFRERAEAYNIRWEHQQLTTPQYVGRRLALLYRAPLRRLRDAAGRKFYKEIDELRAESAVYRINNRALRNDLERTYTEMSGLQAEIEEMSGEIDRLGVELAFKDAELERFADELALKNDELERLLAALAGRDDEVKRLAAELEEAERKMLAPPTAVPERPAATPQSAQRSPGALSRLFKRRKIKQGGQ